MWHFYLVLLDFSLLAILRSVTVHKNSLEYQESGVILTPLQFTAQLPCGLGTTQTIILLTAVVPLTTVSKWIAVSAFGIRTINVHSIILVSCAEPANQDSALLWEHLSVCSAPTFTSFSSFHLHWLEWPWCFCCWSATLLFLRELSMDSSSMPTLSELIRPSFFHSQVHCL